MAPSRREEMLPLLAQGLSQAEVARKLGVRRQEVSRVWCREHPPAPRAPRKDRKPGHPSDRQTERRRARRQQGLCANCGVPSEQYTCGSCKQDYSRQNRKRMDAVAAGLCWQCYAPRGEDGTGSRCRDCAQLSVEYSLAHQARRKEKGPTAQ